MKALFVCLTDYQMLNALNIKVNLLNNKEADILFFDNKEGHEQLAERLRQTGIFKKVFLHRYTNVNGLHKYLRRQANVSFVKAAANSTAEVKYKVLSGLLGKKYKINAKIYGALKIDFGEYDEVYGIPTKDVVKDTMELVLAVNKNALINYIEDGTSTYWKRSIEKDLPINAIYLYQPQLANYYADSSLQNKIKAIPQIDCLDEKFRKILNYVFNFKESKTDYANKVIFFDQNWDPMPDYLQNLSGLKKLLLQNSYKKHLKESAIYNKKIELFRVLADTAANAGRVIVKLHPRSANSFINDYLKSPCTMAENVKAPWEVVEANYTFDDNIWVTVSSTALCSLKTVFKNKNENVKLVFLYKLVYPKEEKYVDDNMFFKSFQKAYPQNVFIPESVEEYMNILN